MELFVLVLSLDCLWASRTRQSSYIRGLANAKMSKKEKDALRRVSSC